MTRRFSYEDIKGQRFNFLIAKEYIGNSEWVCLCDCGNETVVQKHPLQHNKIKSCGCMSKQLISQANSTERKNNKRLYKVYESMKQRCLNPNNDSYHHYGGRGITICGKWLKDYSDFYKWAISNGYRDNLTIDRIDVNGNYTPSNCRWVGWEEQSTNKRNTIREKVNGEELTIQELSKKYNLSDRALYYRYYQGYRGKRLVKPSGYFKKTRKANNE